MNDQSAMEAGEETVRLTIRVPKSLLRTIDESAFVYDVNRNVAICRALSVDFYGALATWNRVALAARVEDANRQLAEELGRITKPLRKIVEGISAAPQKRFTNLIRQPHLKGQT